jgi:hypothetical protein
LNPPHSFLLFPSFLSLDPGETLGYTRAPGGLDVIKGEEVFRRFRNLGEVWRC